MFRRSLVFSSLGAVAPNGGDKCRTSHHVSPPSRLGKDVRATERYTPCSDPPLLRLRYSRLRSGNHAQVQKDFLKEQQQQQQHETLGVRELVVSHSVFSDQELEGMYEQLRNEVLSVPAEVTSAASFIKPLHKDPRLGKPAPAAHIGTAIRRWDLYAPHCPTLVSVTDRLAAHFKVQAATNRLNWFRSAADHKPFHHDAHAFDMGEGQYFDPKTPAAASAAECSSNGSTTEATTAPLPPLTYNGLYKGKAANCTVVASFGAERWYCVQDATNPSAPSHLGGTVAVHVPHGTVVAMGRDANILWRHGVPPGTPATSAEEASPSTTNLLAAADSGDHLDHIFEKPGEGRMSIVVTGWVDQQEESGWSC